MSAGAPAAGPAPAGPTGRGTALVLAALALTLLLASLDQTIVATALPTIAGELGGLGSLSAVVTAYLVASAVVTLVYGKLSDLYGRKRLFLVALGLFLTGSALCGLSGSMTQLVLFRGVQGLGGGGLMSLSLTIVADVVPPRSRARVQGWFGGVFAVSSVAGPLLGGYLVDSVSWRWVFYVNLPLGLAAAVATAVALPDRGAAGRHRLDYGGAALVAAAVTSLVLLTTWGGSRYPWSSPQSIALAAATVVSTVALLAVEGRAPEPIVPLGLLTDRALWATSLAALLVGAVMFGAVTYLPLFLQLVTGASATGSGLLLLPLLGALVVASVVAGQLIAHTGRWRPFPLTGVSLAAAAVVLMSRLDDHSSRVEVSAFMILLGAGIGMTQQVLTLVAQAASPLALLGVATSMSTFSRSLGSTVGVSVFGTVLTTRLAAELARRLPAGAGAAGPVDVLGGPARIAQLPPRAHDAVVVSFAHAVQLVFLAAVPVAVAALLAVLAVPRVALDGTPPVRRPERRPPHPS